MEMRQDPARRDTRAAAIRAGVDTRAVFFAVLQATYVSACRVGDVRREAKTSVGQRPGPGRVPARET